MSGMLDGIGQEQIAATLSRNEWSVILTALYEAHMPLKLTSPVAGKVQMLLLPRQHVPAREETRHE
jgi:hypothetical protein